jgi:diaminohydroxyphosphoribosylaminopyrimidine deaminase/5-amino-6-(5-phosphoribosylamino)uracil reductase
MDDTGYMRAALGLARRELGRCWPNPAVGCVLVRDGQVVGRGWTRAGGRPHAEAEALGAAGDAARGATAYVTLEPCAHVSERGPACTDSLLSAGVARVVVGEVDPDPRTRGSGIARLQAAGVRVDVGICAPEAGELHAGFRMRLREGRPLVTLKLATSLDGRIALANGESRWITGPAARARAHLIRAESDAVLVGAATARADDPDLTCRLPGLGHRSPVRVILASRVEPLLPLKLIQTAREVPTWIVTAETPAAHVRDWIEKAGARLLPAAADARGRPEAKAALMALGQAGLTRLMVEGGGAVAATLLAAGLIDRIAWFRAPVALGADGRPGLGPLGLTTLGGAPRFCRMSLETLGEDALETLTHPS